MQVPKGLQALPTQVSTLLSEVGRISEGVQKLPTLIDTLERMLASIEKIEARTRAASFSSS